MSFGKLPSDRRRLLERRPPRPPVVPAAAAPPRPPTATPVNRGTAPVVPGAPQQPGVALNTPGAVVPGTDPTRQSTLPIDPAYDAAHAGYEQQRGNAQGDYTYGVGQAQRDYGYTPQADGTYAVDPSNPFSRAALLQRSIDQARARTGTSYAASGQLYSGALQRAQNNNAFNADAQRNALTNQFTGTLHGLSTNLRDTLAGIGQADTTAFGDRVNRALAAGVPVYSQGSKPVPKSKPPSLNKRGVARILRERRSG